MCLSLKNSPLNKHIQIYKNLKTEIKVKYFIFAVYLRVHYNPLDLVKWEITR